MTAARPTVFGIGALAAITLAVVLLRDILLPFVAGIALAYLLDPVVERIERLGVSRTVAALGIVGLFISALAAYWYWSRLSLARRLPTSSKSFPSTSENCKPLPIIRAAHGCARSSAKD
jgi:predicted PurR-regulated permease PerM